MTDFLTDLQSSLARHEQERAELVPVRIWSDKCTSMIVWMTKEQAEHHNKLTKRKGQSSTLRNVMHNGGRLC